MVVFYLVIPAWLVIPAQAGIQKKQAPLDTRFRGYDRRDITLLASKYTIM